MQQTFLAATPFTFNSHSHPTLSHLVFRFPYKHFKILSRVLRKSNIFEKKIKIQTIDPLLK